RTFNPRVVGSSPTGPTMTIPVRGVVGSRDTCSTLAAPARVWEHSSHTPSKGTCHDDDAGPHDRHRPDAGSVAREARLVPLPRGPGDGTAVEDAHRRRRGGAGVRSPRF